jgi:hypothetical protein
MGLHSATKRSDPLIMTKIRRRRGPAITDLMVAAKQGGSCLRTIVRRLPNLSVPKELPGAQLPASLPTQGSVAAADRVALEEHAVARDRLRRAKAAARWRPFLKGPQVASVV